MYNQNEIDHNCGCLVQDSRVSYAVFMRFRKKIIAFTVLLAMCGVFCTDKLCAMNELPVLGGGPNAYNNIQTNQFAIPSKDTCGNVLLYPATDENNLMIILQSGLARGSSLELANKISANLNDNILILGGIDVVLAAHKGVLNIVRNEDTHWCFATWAPQFSDDFITSLLENPGFFKEMQQYAVKEFLQCLLHYSMNVNDGVTHFGDRDISISHADSSRHCVEILTGLLADLNSPETLTRARDLLEMMFMNHVSFHSTLFNVGFLDFYSKYVSSLDDLRFVENAVRWLRYTLHTEAQIAVLGQIRAINISLNNAPRGAASLAIAEGINCYSLYNPCNSCKTLTWVNNRNGQNLGFEYAIRDNNAMEDRFRNVLNNEYCQGYLRNAGVKYNVADWRNVRNALRNWGIKEALNNNRSFIDLLRLAGFQDVEDAMVVRLQNVLNNEYCQRYLRNAGVKYNVADWRNVRNALRNWGIKEALNNNRSFIDLLRLAGFQDVEDFADELNNRDFADELNNFVNELNNKIPNKWRNIGPRL